MSISKTDLSKLLYNEKFPLSGKYDPQWVVQNQMGPSALWLTEWLCREMQLKPGMRVLDMGCGMCLSSVFLAKEFGVEVWANDLWISASDNWQIIRQAGLEKHVFPIHAEAHSLPYAEEFFDAIVSLDSHHYYGTDDIYLNYFAKFVKPGGQIGITVPALMREFDGSVPEHLTRPQKNGSVFWTDECWCIRTRDFWRNLWGRTSLVDVELADTLVDGWRYWAQFDKAVQASGAAKFPSEAEVVETDGGRYLGFVRMIARRSQAQE